MANPFPRVARAAYFPTMSGLLSAGSGGGYSRRAVLVGVGAAATLAACAAGGEDEVDPTTEPAAPTGDGGTTAGGGGVTADAAALVALADVPVGGAVAVTTPEGDEILVAQPSEGEVVAFSAVCTHQGCIIAPDADVLRCPCHGSQFDLRTGEVLGGPADEPLPAVAVEVRGADVVAS
jgi:cytochrome b6-f complex iron-sulfur subunit